MSKEAKMLLEQTIPFVKAARGSEELIIELENFVENYEDIICKDVCSLGPRFNKLLIENNYNEKLVTLLLHEVIKHLTKGKQ